MREMTERLADDPELAAAYRRAHEAYLAERDAIEPLGTDVSAGGMPDRVKCLHVHAAHALAAGPGVNPFGDEALAEVGEWWAAGPLRPPRYAVERASRPAAGEPVSRGVTRARSAVGVRLRRQGARGAPRAVGEEAATTTNAAATSSGACRSSSEPCRHSASISASRRARRSSRPAQLGAQLRTPRSNHGSAPAAASISASTASTESGSRVTARSTSSAVTLPEPSQIEFSGASR